MILQKKYTKLNIKIDIVFSKYRNVKDNLIKYKSTFCKKGYCNKLDCFDVHKDYLGKLVSTECYPSFCENLGRNLQR